MSETISKTIERLEAKRAAEWQTAHALLETAEGEDRDLNEDERTAFEAIMGAPEKDEAGNLKAGTGGSIAELDQRIANLKRAEAAGFKSQAIQKLSTKGDPLVDVKPKDRPKGSIFAFAGHCLFHAQGNRAQAAAYARERFDDHIAAFMLETPDWVLEDAMASLHKAAAVPAGTTGDADFASKLVQVRQLAEEFRQFWWPKSIAGRLQMRRLTFEGYGSIKIPGNDAATVGYWVAEAGPIPAESMTIGEIELTPYKMGVISVVTNELLRRSTPQVQGILTDALGMGVARTVDARFIGAAAAGSGAPAGLFNGVTPYDAGAGGAGGADGVDLAGVETTAKAMIAVLAAADVPAGGWAWVMTESQRNHIKFLMNSLGIPAYRQEVMEGSWLGYDLIESNKSTASALHLIAGPQVFWADEMLPMISLSDSAAVELDDAPAGVAVPTSLWQKDMLGIRLTTAVDWKKSRAASAYWAANVGW